MTGTYIPVASGEIGDREERFPTVGGTITKVRRDIGTQRGERVQVLFRPAGQTLTQQVRFGIDLTTAELLDGFPIGATFHSDRYRPIRHRVGKLANPGER